MRRTHCRNKIVDRAFAVAMPALLRPVRSRWIWPASFGGAALVLLLVFMMPVAWWRLLAPPRALHAACGRPDEPDLRIVELAVVRPIPEIREVLEDRPLREPDSLPLDPEWWQEAWHGRFADDLHAPAAASPDSCLPPVLAAILNSRADLDLILDAPDSVIEARLWRLAQVEKLTRNDLEGFYSAIARARAYADLKSREAAMYGEFLNETVPVSR